MQSNSPARKTKRSPKATRSEKVTQSLEAQKAKTNKWVASNGIMDFQLSASQQELQDKIMSNTLTWCVGPAGTGKSLAVLYTFVKEYLKDNTKQIIILRTPVEAGMDRIGHLPNDYNQKVEPHFASAKKLLEQLLSKGKVETDLDHRIQFKIPNFCLGATFDNSLVFIDEAQQLQPMIMKLLLERIGENSRVVVAGDNTQLYAHAAEQRNGLKDALPRFFHQDMTPKYPEMAYHEFSVEDVMRSDIVKSIIRGYTGM